MDQILSTIRTTAEAQEVLSSLDAFSSNLFITKSDSKTIDTYFSHLNGDIAHAIVSFFGNEPLSETNREKIKLQIGELQEKIRKCKKVQITIAFHPDEETLSTFSYWVKTNAGKEFLIDIQINKTIIAGAQITANGLHKDYSLRKKLAEVFQIQRDKIKSFLEGKQEAEVKDKEAAVAYQ